MKINICRRCRRRNDEKPKTGYCPNSRARHIWVSISSQTGMRANISRREEEDAQAELDEERQREPEDAPAAGGAVED